VLGLQVVERGKGPQRQEAGLQVINRPLHLAVRGRPPRRQHDDPRAQGAEQPRHLRMQARPHAGTGGHDRTVVVKDQLLRHAAQPLQTAQQGGPQVAGRRREGKRHRMRG